VQVTVLNAKFLTTIYELGVIASRFKTLVLLKHAFLCLCHRKIVLGGIMFSCRLSVRPSVCPSGMLFLQCLQYA